ncbi:MAG TPA: hypothetical protein VKV73_16630 [Chloroflexota bacterium]|nr:hypothetical protein [Chloroflexota bacterium]
MSLGRRDWTLLTIAAAEGAPVTPVQLQKSLFLLGQELPNIVGPRYYAFEAYNYGPFDAAVYRDAENLAVQGLVDIERPEGARYNQYRISADGRAKAEELRQQAPQQALKYLATVVQWARGLSFPELVRAIYAKYPQYRVNSVFSG